MLLCAWTGGGYRAYILWSTLCLRCLDEKSICNLLIRTRWVWILTPQELVLGLHRWSWAECFHPGDDGIPGEILKHKQEKTRITYRIILYTWYVSFSPSLFTFLSPLICSASVLSSATDSLSLSRSFCNVCLHSLSIFRSVSSCWLQTHHRHIHATPTRVSRTSRDGEIHGSRFCFNTQIYICVKCWSCFFKSTTKGKTPTVKGDMQHELGPWQVLVLRTLTITADLTRCTCCLGVKCWCLCKLESTSESAFEGIFLTVVSLCVRSAAAGCRPCWRSPAWSVGFPPRPTCGASQPPVICTIITRDKLRTKERKNWRGWRSDGWG